MIFIPAHWYFQGLAFNFRFKIRRSDLSSLCLRLFQDQASGKYSLIYAGSFAYAGSFIYADSLIYAGSFAYAGLFIQTDLLTYADSPTYADSLTYAGSFTYAEYFCFYWSWEPLEMSASNVF